MKHLSISTEKQMYDTKDFFVNLKNALSDFDNLPLEFVVTKVKSEEFKSEREVIENAFWDFFTCISKDDDSLDSCIYLQKYGFNIVTPVKESDIISLYSDEDSI